MTFVKESKSEVNRFFIYPGKGSDTDNIVLNDKIGTYLRDHFK